MKALLVLLLLTLAGTCHAQNPATATQAVVRLTPVLYVEQIAPPPEYARWYADTERCSGLHGDFATVRWYMAAAPWVGGNGITFGMWQDGRRITLNAPERMDSTLVMHEIMHDLVALNGLTDPLEPHPAAYFGPGKCVYRFHPGTP